MAGWSTVVRIPFAPARAIEEFHIRIAHRENVIALALFFVFTALALTLALFRANPSPFCILDEADSALDENNLDQFVGIINEFVSETQFIVVTHHKSTMAAADVLYGVTMERKGVSKKVSVDLNGEAGLDLLRQKKISRRNEYQAKARKEANAMATAVLEADLRLGPGSEEPDPS